MARISLCQLFETMAAAQPSLAEVVPILAGLNAVSTSRADLEPDFDKRFEVCMLIPEILCIYCEMLL